MQAMKKITALLQNSPTAKIKLVVQNQQSNKGIFKDLYMLID